MLQVSWSCEVEPAAPILGCQRSLSPHATAVARVIAQLAVSLSRVGAAARGFGAATALGSQVGKERGSTPALMLRMYGCSFVPQRALAVLLRLMLRTGKRDLSVGSECSRCSITSVNL